MNKMLKIYPMLEDNCEIHYSSKLSKVAKRVYRESYADCFRGKTHKSMSQYKRAKKCHEYGVAALKDYYEFQEKLRTGPD